MIGKGISPQAAAIGWLYPDDVRLETGLLVADDGRVFEFSFDWWYDDEGNELSSPNDARLSEFRQVSRSEMSDMDKELEAIAREVLGDSKP